MKIPNFEKSISRYQEAMPKGVAIRSTAAVGFEYCNHLFAIEKDLEQLNMMITTPARADQFVPGFVLSMHPFVNRLRLYHFSAEDSHFFLSGR